MKTTRTFAALTTALFSFISPLSQAHAAGAIDPNLRLAVQRANQSVVLSWFGASGAAYQVESSSSLTAWTNSSLVVTGRGALLTLTNAITGRSHDFFRLKCLLPTQVITADFAPARGTLTIVGDESDNVITVSRDRVGTLRVNAGAVAIRGGPATVGNTTVIQIFGRGGHDELALDEANGALPRAQMLGEAGNDTLIGGSGADVLNGGPGRDTLFGRGGGDSLLGGDDGDVVTGGEGDDIVQLGLGDDRFIWNSGDGNDVVEGQAGTDTLIVNGSNAGENIDLAANGSRLRVSRDVGNVVLDCNDMETVRANALDGADSVVIGELATTHVRDVMVDLATPSGPDAHTDTITINATQGNDAFGVTNAPSGLRSFGLSATVTIQGPDAARDRLVLNALGGADTADASRLSAGVIQLTLNGGLGNDVLIGSAGADVFNGGDGNDVALCGAGDDTFIWNPGDDNDTVEGQGGTDTLIFNGANVAESIDLSANGGRLRFIRNVGNVVLDCNDIEVVNHFALGGADTIVVNNLSGTDVTQVNLNLAAASGGGDGFADSIIINGTATNDSVTVSGSASGVTAAGLSARVTITHSEGANDRLTINLLAGEDILDAAGLPSGLIGLTADGGGDNDVLTGSAGNDVVLGGPGDDILRGGPGVDVLDGGPGNNTVIQD